MFCVVNVTSGYCVSVSSVGKSGGAVPHCLIVGVKGVLRNSLGHPGSYLSQDASYQTVSGTSATEPIGLRQ